MSLLDSFIGRKMIGSKPVSEGRHRLIKAAVGEDAAKSAGKFFADDQVREEAQEVLAEQNKEKIWAICVKYTGL